MIYQKVTLVCKHTHVCQYQSCRCTCDPAHAPIIALCGDCWEALQVRLCDALNLTHGELAVFLADGTMPKQRTCK
jgi:hypothetical protein